jgi:hypothetical protein
MPLMPSSGGNSATNDGAPEQTITPIPAPDEGDQDVRNMPSNGAIPDQVRTLIPGPEYHVPFCEEFADFMERREHTSRW